MSGFACWTFGRERDGRVIAEVHVACYGIDALDAAAQCVKHLLVDVCGGIADGEPRRVAKDGRRTVRHKRPVARAAGKKNP